MTRAPAGGVAWLLIGAMVGSLIAGSLPAGALCLAAAVVGAALAGAPWPSRRWIAVMAGGALGVWALNACLVRGAPLLHLGPVGVTREGIARGALVALRLIGAATALLGLRAAWPGERAADELARLLAPFERLGLPVARARAMLGLALRFAPLLADEARRIARLQDLRAGREPRGAVEWLERRRAATVPTLVHSLERAEQLSLALEARHYRLRPARTAPAVSPGAWGWAAGGVVLAGAAALWRG
jgi:energy-coupling factor transport system permease protein